MDFMTSMRLYQRFDLDEESARKAIVVGGLNVVDAMNSIRKQLLDKSYSIFESNESLNGITNSMILGGRIGQNSKADLSKITEKLGLRYSSGPFYQRISRDWIRPEQ